MPSSRPGVTVPPEPAAVARRYRRVERPVSVGVAVLVGAVALVLVRVPLVRSGGTARLVADRDLESVVSEFASATPPPLAFQWGTADDVRETDDGAVYDLSYLFGLRTVRMETTVRRREPARGDATIGVDLTVSAGGRPWGSYTVSVVADGAETLVDVKWTSERRFGLRRVPQWLVARRYRPDALAAQGYSVAAYDASLSLSDDSPVRWTTLRPVSTRTTRHRPVRAVESATSSPSRLS